MQVAHYTNCYKPRINGVVRSISVFKRALENLGHEVHLFAPSAPGYQDDEPHVYRYPTLPWDSAVVYRPPIPVSAYLERLALDLAPQIVHTHHPALLGWVARGLARRLDVPLVYTLHSQYHAYGGFLPYGREMVADACGKIIVSFMRRCQRIIVPTLAVRDQIISDDPTLAPRLTMLPTPLPPSAFEPVDGNGLREQYGLNHHFTFVVAGRLSVEKGLAELLQAFTLLRRRRPNVRLLLVGDGPERKDLEHEAQELGVAEDVIFAGMIPFEHMPRHLTAGDAFVFTSRVEAQGLVLCEAMAVGLPVVAYDAPFIRDVVVDGENGLLAEPSAEALAWRMERLVDDAALRERLAATGLVTARRYDAVRIAGDLARIYEEAIEERRRFGPPA